MNPGIQKSGFGNDGGESRRMVSKKGNILKEITMAPRYIDGFRVDAVSDIPDFRDHSYMPALIQLAPIMPPPRDPYVLNQGREGACTGFGLAAVINLLNQRRNSPVRVSARMLYEMAKKFDQWPGEKYAGSSCRGAIKGWYSMGVCSEKLAPYRIGEKNWHLNIKRAKDARANTIGAYYRLSKNIVHMHAAMNEVGVIYASANVHAGWSADAIKNGVIKQSTDIKGGHAFAIVGYDADGFWIQNSWGRNWGKEGLAHWSYEDWQDNVSDAWVVRLALPTPQLWGREHGGDAKAAGKSGLFTHGPRRDEIAGHFIHIDDGKFHDSGKYWSNLSDVQETAAHVAKSAKYKHLLIYAHGGLNSMKASATRIAAMKGVFKANGIYPFHFMYDTGMMEELKDVLLGKRSSTEEIVGGFADWWDRRFEQATRRPGRALWREMKNGAAAPFVKSNSPGTKTMSAFLDALGAQDAISKKIHLAGHSTGGILLAHLLNALVRLKVQTRISSVSLLAPAATRELFDTHYAPLLGSKKKAFGIDRMNIYNLNEKLEKDDNVAKIYRKSLLYLVSNAFEETQGAEILGMMVFARKIPAIEGLAFIQSRDGGKKIRSSSATHGGFDNDPDTLNDVLKTILGREPERPFKKEDLDY
jgi:hypothetical protein